VSNEDIDKITEAARWAPSAFNSQLWKFVIVKQQELKDRIVEFLNEYGAWKSRVEPVSKTWQKAQWQPLSQEKVDYSNAPVFIILFGDNRTRIGLPTALQNDNSRYNNVFISSLANAFLYMPPQPWVWLHNG